MNDKKDDITTTIIRIQKKTAEKIKSLKIAKFETYDEIINRLINDKTIE